MAAALDDMEPEAREVVPLRDIEGLSASEVAQVTGMSVSAVKSRLHRARQSLRERLLAVVGEPSELATPACPDVLTLLSKKLEEEVSTLEVCSSLPTPVVPPHVQESLRRAVREAIQEGAAVRT